MCRMTTSLHIPMIPMSTLWELATSFEENGRLIMHIQEVELDTSNHGFKVIQHIIANRLKIDRWVVRDVRRVGEQFLHQLRSVRPGTQIYALVDRRRGGETPRRPSVHRARRLGHPRRPCHLPKILRGFAMRTEQHVRTIRGVLSFRLRLKRRTTCHGTPFVKIKILSVLFNVKNKVHPLKNNEPRRKAWCKARRKTRRETGNHQEGCSVRPDTNCEQAVLSEVLQRVDRFHCMRCPKIQRGSIVQAKR